jgi:hypothetical protein
MRVVAPLRQTEKRTTVEKYGKVANLLKNAVVDLIGQQQTVRLRRFPAPQSILTA